MAVAAVDSNILIGISDSDDQHHQPATEIVQAIDYGDLPTARVTNYILLEALNWIHTRQRHAKAVELHTRLKESAGFEIIQTAQKDFHRAVDLFDTHDGLSFGDATITAYMEREEIEYLYSFDDDFDALDGIIRFETVENPFE
jgi:predicted nucleic acid-binding protein